MPTLVALGLALSLAPSDASGEPRRIELQWRAPAGCPTKAQIRR